MNPEYVNRCCVSVKYHHNYYNCTYTVPIWRLLSYTFAVVVIVIAVFVIEDVFDSQFTVCNK